MTHYVLALACNICSLGAQNFGSMESDDWELEYIEKGSYRFDFTDSRITIEFCFHNLSTSHAMWTNQILSMYWANKKNLQKIDLICLGRCCKLMFYANYSLQLIKKSLQVHNKMATVYTN